MDKNKQPVSKNDIIMLQAYLEQIVSIENKCKENFAHTEWYLQEKYSDDEVNTIINFFKVSGAQCDCDLVKKF